MNLWEEFLTLVLALVLALVLVVFAQLKTKGNPLTGRNNLVSLKNYRKRKEIIPNESPTDKTRAR